MEPDMLLRRLKCVAHPRESRQLALALVTSVIEGGAEPEYRVYGLPIKIQVLLVVPYLRNPAPSVVIL
jgi:hypothetical protein